MEVQMPVLNRMLAISTAALLATTVFGQISLGSETKVGEAAFGDWNDDAPGVKRHIRPEDLPAPQVSVETVANFPDTADRPADTKPKVPDGFSIEMVASGLIGPRVIRVAPNGDLFVAESKANQVRVYRMGKDTNKPDKEEVFATGLYQPYGIAFYPPGPNPEWVYVAGERRLPFLDGGWQRDHLAS
jgi:glucose/arabinose dehydrogenase